VESAPLSIMAMVTELEPVVTAQACGAELLGRCHWLPKDGSLGVAAAVWA